MNPFDRRVSTSPLTRCQDQERQTRILSAYRQAIETISLYLTRGRGRPWNEILQSKEDLFFLVPQLADFVFLLLTAVRIYY